MSDETVRVRYLLGVEVGGVRHEAGAYEADVTSAEAKALVKAGRVEICKPAAPVDAAVAHADGPHPEHQS